MSVKKDDVSEDERSMAKAVNFGLMYGQSSFGLASSLKISRKEALKIVKKIDGLADPKNEKSFCDYLNISREKYDEILSSFVNQDLFVKGNKGKWLPKFKRV